MERKTKIQAEDGRQDILITREFDLPLELLFKAYVVPEIVEQWMGTRVLKLENTRHGGWQFETKDANGQVVFGAHGVIHDLVPNQKITRTFEMDQAAFDAQLEFLEFESLGKTSSRLSIHIVYKSSAIRDAVLKLPFAYGINMAHDRLQEVLNKMK